MSFLETSGEFSARRYLRFAKARRRARQAAMLALSLAMIAVPIQYLFVLVSPAYGKFDLLVGLALAGIGSGLVSVGFFLKAARCGRGLLFSDVFSG